MLPYIQHTMGFQPCSVDNSDYDWLCVGTCAYQGYGLSGGGKGAPFKLRWSSGFKSGVGNL